MNSLIRIVVFGFGLVPAVALGNAGPAVWTGPAAVGEARPGEAIKTRLIREKLDIVVDPGGSTYSAKAVYTLDNRQGPAEVTVAVPLLVPEGVTDGDHFYHETSERQVRNAAKRVDLEVGGQAVRCQIDEKAVIKSQRLLQSPHPWLEDEDKRGFEFKISWCQVKLKLPKKITG
jgi:hypothetical protein